MLAIDIKFKLKDMDFEFKADVKRGVPYKFEVGERILGDKLFWVLCGLDRGYEGKIEGEGLSFNASSFNNILALGDRSMFVRGNVRRNIYKALRVRAHRKIAKARTEEVIKLYHLERIESFKTDLLDDKELLNVALARAHYRKIGLVVFNKAAAPVEIELTKFSDAYIVIVC